MHYGLAATVIKAVEDFLEGPEGLADGSAAAAADIRRVRAAYPETVVRPMTELPELVPDFRDAQTARAANPPGNERLTWLKRAVWLAADRPGRVGFVPAGDAHWWHVSTFSRAVVTDMGEPVSGSASATGRRPRSWPGAAPGAGPAAVGGPGGRGALPGGARAPHEPGQLGAAVRPARPAMIAGSVRRAARSGRIRAEPAIMAGRCRREGRPPAARRVPRQRRRVGLHPHPRPRAGADRARRSAGDGGRAAASRSWSATRGLACT